MICLDTDYLILGLVAGSPESERLIAWSGTGQTFCAASTAWYEFLCGPITAAQVTTMQGVLQAVLPFDARQAQEAARLFHATGRQRRLRVPAMIAAAALVERASLATGNRDDFSSFVPLGLELAE